MDTLSALTTAPASWDDLSRPVPHAHLLGSAGLTAVVTAAGTGSVQFEGADLTRFRADRVTDADGLFVYLHDLDTGRIWSAGRQPTGAVPDNYRAYVGPGTVTVERTDGDVRTTTTWAAAPDRPALLAQVHIENLSTDAASRPRRIEVTTYGEVALNDRGGGREPPGVLQAVRGDGEGRGQANAARSTAPAHARGRAAVAVPLARRRRRRDGRDRPDAVCWAWPRHARSGRASR